MPGAFQLMAPQTATLGDALAQQVAGDTEEERKRMGLVQQQRSLGPGAQLAVSSLLAPGSGRAAGY